MNIDLEKHIWEGWTVGDFINDLQNSFDMIMKKESWHQPFTSYDQLKAWVMDNQPHYKKHIPEVYEHFKKEYQQYQK